MTSGGTTNEIRIVELQGTAEVAAATATIWMPAQVNQVLHPSDRLRTGANSRMALLWSDRSVVSFGALTELEVSPPDSAGAQCGLHLLRGIVSFFHRDEPGRIRVITRGAVAGVEGTEFVLADDTEHTTLSVIDGKVRLGNEQATLLLTNGQQAVVEPGKAPVRTAGFIANNVLQWCFYYPAVIDPADLPFTPEEQTILGESLQAYRSGDLPAALAKYPAGRQPGSDVERVYYAGLLLGVGQVEPAETALASLSVADASSRPQRVALALRRLISAVKRQPDPAVVRPQLATELLANSYYEQSRAIPGVSLPAALDSARRAVTNSPYFGFGWERVAELEFSFGRTDRAIDALDKSLAFAPRNAQMLALEGFLLAAQNRTGEALRWFDQALAVDSALGNAWLGRGLCRIHRGDAKGGREDLLVAAALEPQRAGLRSYLGKAYADAGDYTRATRELRLAEKLDPKDPTAWLYSALLNQENNRINDAIRDLEKSQALNDNRSVYRSQLLLDQDRAVRSANLAAMYRDAGMDDVAAREASRAVNFDYANYSAHLFLANSYAQLSDPNLINLRYETPTENEYLLANLLAPVSAGTMSPTISQQEYSPLFERNRLGVVSDTEYLSRGAWTQSGSQFGVFDNFSYAVEGFYRTDPGQRVNNDVEQRQLSGTFKVQATPQDTVYLQVKQYEANSGDLAQYYNPTNANPSARVNEDQTPIIGLGYHHEWSPGVHTLLFATRIDDSLSVTNPTGPTSLAVLHAWRNTDLCTGLTMQEHLEDDLTLYSGELQQIWQTPEHNTIVGARFQYGDFDIHNLQDTPSALPFLFPNHRQCRTAGFLVRVPAHFRVWLSSMAGFRSLAIDRRRDLRPDYLSGKFPDGARFRNRPDRGSVFSQGRPHLDAVGWRHPPFRLYPLVGRREPGPKLSTGAFAGGGLHPILPEPHSGIGGRAGSRGEISKLMRSRWNKSFPREPILVFPATCCIPMLARRWGHSIILPGDAIPGSVRTSRESELPGTIAPVHGQPVDGQELVARRAISSQRRSIQLQF